MTEDRHVALWRELKRLIALSENLENDAAIVAIGRDMQRLSDELVWVEAKSPCGLAAKLRWLEDTITTGVPEEASRHILREVIRTLEEAPARGNIVP